MNEREIELDLTLDGSAHLLIQDEPFLVSLNQPEQDTLLGLLEDAWLTRHGLERVGIKWEDALAGDVIPCLGGKLIDVPHVLPETDRLRGYIQGVGQLDLNRGLELRVNRVIS